MVANPFSSLEAKFVVLPKRGVCGYVLLVEEGDWEWRIRVVLGILFRSKVILPSAVEKMKF